MKIVLKNVHCSNALSQETTAYTADVWIDGIKKGTASNNGCGGQDLILPGALREELETYAKTLPASKVELYDMVINQSADMLLADALDYHLNSKKLKSLLKNKILSVSIKDGKIYTSKTKPVNGYTILNDLTFDEAYEIFVKVLK